MGNNKSRNFLGFTRQWPLIKLSDLRNFWDSVRILAFIKPTCTYVSHLLHERQKRHLQPVMHFHYYFLQNTRATKRSTHATWWIELDFHCCYRHYRMEHSTKRYHISSVLYKRWSDNLVFVLIRLKWMPL